MFAGVSTVLFSAVVILPFIYGLYLTFTSWDGVSKDKPFVGLANYIATFQDAAYWQALGRTLIYSVIAVILVNVVAFFLAYLLTSGIKGQNFFRAGFFVPNLIGGIVLGYVWKFVFNRAFVSLGKSLSVGALSTSWLATTNGAMACLIIVFCVAVRRIYDADLCSRIYERIQEPYGSSPDRRLHQDTGNH